MTTYAFTVVVDRDPTDYADALYETDQGDSVPEGGNGQGSVHVTRDADTLAAAILDAVHSVGLVVTGVQSDDLVSLKDIAARLARTYESVRLLAAGKRGPGRFPTPLSTGQWALYSWTEVAAWFAEHYGTERPSVFDREIAAADHLIRARRMLAGDANRAELSQLVTAS